jgi:tetratricopeptide (TPR) repeat protein
MPYSGDYASGRNAALLYSKGPAAELSEAEVLEAVLRHFSTAADQGAPREESPGQRGEDDPAGPRTLQAAPSEAGGLADLKRKAEFHLKVEGRIEEALRIYHQVLVDHPDDVDALLAFGKICTDLNRPEDAVPFYERALCIDPGNRYALETLKQMKGIPRNAATNQR